MKRVISASSSSTDMFFNTKTTGTSFYDNFLNADGLKYMQDAKNLTGAVRYWTPQKYFQECAEMFGVSVDSLIRQRSYDSKMMDEYVAAMIRGDKFPLCYIDYSDDGQEGLHRMLAASRIAGWDTVSFPVLVVAVYDWNIHEKHLKLKAMSDYERWDFVRDIDAAADEISDWGNPVPDDVCEQMKAAVEKIAWQKHNVRIVVECEVEEIDGGHRLNVYLDSYQGTENEVLTNASKNWLEDMFATDPSSDSTEDSTSDLDMTDEIDREFFKY